MKKLNAYAKINVGLSILNKRLDNYHNLESIMLPISLHDIISVESTQDKEITLTTKNQPIPKKQNLIYSIAKYLQDTYNVKTGLKITLEKNIPVSAGMGGGSSDAATILNYLNELWGLKLTDTEKISIGTKFGADIPFSIFNKPAFVEGIGEKLTHFMFKPFFSIIVVKMPVAVSTKHIFEQMNFNDITFPNIEKIQSSLISNNKVDFIEYLGNNMETITTKMHPEINIIKEKLLELGCFASTMSGSGPTVLGFVDFGTHKEIIAELKKIGYTSYYCNIVNQ